MANVIPILWLYSLRTAIFNELFQSIDFCFWFFKGNQFEEILCFNSTIVSFNATFEGVSCYFSFLFASIFIAVVLGIQLASYLLASSDFLGRKFKVKNEKQERKHLTLYRHITSVQQTKITLQLCLRYYFRVSYLCLFIFYLSSSIRNKQLVFL